MKRSANEFMRTITGRLAGNGMNSDNYSEDSFPLSRPFGYKYAGGWWDSQKWEESEVVTYKISEEEMEKVLQKCKETLDKRNALCNFKNEGEMK